MARYRALSETSNGFLAGEEAPLAASSPVGRYGRDMTVTVAKRRAVVLIVVAVAAVLNYLGWLGWDQRRDVHPDGSRTGPYEPWQVVGLVVVTVALAFAVGRFGVPRLGGLVIPVAMTVSFVLDATSDSESDGLWPIGAFLVLVGTMVGCMFVASLAARGASPAGWERERV